MPKPASASLSPLRVLDDGNCVNVGDDQRTALDLAMEASHLIWWDWDIPADRFVLHAAGSCIFEDDDVPLPPDSAGWFERVHPDDRRRVRETLDSCLRGARARWDCEHRLRVGRDAWLWVSNHGRVMDRDTATRRPLRMIGTTLDIEARKRAEAMLARDSALLAHIQDAVYCLDTDLNYTYWNAGAERLYGWSAAELIGRPFAIRFPLEHAVEHQAGIRRVLAGETFSAELESYRRDGSSVWVDMQAYRLLDEHGRVTGMMNVARDITQRRCDQAERLRIEHQLAQSQKMETLGTLAGGIAHDFNNLLAAILGYAEITGALLPAGHPALAKLDNVTAAGKRAAELVRRILAFSRSSEQTRVPVDLNQLVQETLSLLRASLPATIALAPSLSPVPALTQGDATQLQQILLNCCANSAHALRARSDGRISLVVELLDLGAPPATQAGSLQAGPHVRLSIGDNGCGMPAEVVAHIFEPFFTTKPRGEGTGLGLAMAQGIITAHGGAIRVESQPGGGTLFEIYLPALLQRPPTAAETGDAPTLVRGSGETIAVIDDEESIALLAQQALEHNGYRAVAFGRARQCLDRLLEWPDAFRLVITDQTMPQMTGLELIKALRAVGNPVPVLMLSGYARGLAPAELMGLGHVGFLGKPFDLAALFREAHRLLHLAR